MRGKQLLAITACALVAVFAACGGGEAERSASHSVSTPAKQPPRLTAKQRGRLEARARRAAAREQRREAIERERPFTPNRWPEPGPSRAHPHGRVHRLAVREIARGTGPSLRGDENVYVNYVKTYWRTGRKFLVAWGPGRADYFNLPSQAPGIRRGMTGMRPGGRRVITMPRAIGDVHEPNGRGGWEEAQVDVVLREILPHE